VSKSKPAQVSALPVNGVKVFAATTIRARQELSEQVNVWFQEHGAITVFDVIVNQSSDSAFHCVSIAILYWDPGLVFQASPTNSKASL
jgi:hypothetical protein